MPNLGDVATRALAIGRGRCPECRPENGPNAIRRAPKLKPSGGLLVCPECDAAYQNPGGGVP